MRASKFVESYFQAWNDSDPEAVASHLAKDGVYCDIPEDSERGRDELVENLTDFFRDNHHRYELVGEILKSGNTIAFQYRMVPETTNGESPKCIHGAEFMTLVDGVALSINDYYEVPGMKRPAPLAGLTRGRLSAPKYAKSGLGSEQMLEYKRSLERVMRSRRVYLNPDLTLPKLAEMIGCSVNHLSQVINSGFGMSFFDYVNQYRIEHAKALLSHHEHKDESVLDIAFMVGFNSNSAFYSAFRKAVGQSPAQFRRARLK